MRILTVPAFLVLLITAAPSQKRPTYKLTGQRSFCVECELKEKVRIPENVLPLLTKDAEDMAGCVSEQGVPQIPKSDWFSATSIRLDEGSEDLLVQADNACMWGAHIAPFWILRKTETGWKRIFKVRADAIDVLPSRTNGNSDIKVVFYNVNSSWHSLFKFQVGEYRLIKHR